MRQHFRFVVLIAALALTGLAAACGDALTPTQKEASRCPSRVVAPVDPTDPGGSPSPSTSTCGGPATYVALDDGGLNGQLKSGTSHIFTAAAYDADSCRVYPIFSWKLSNTSVAYFENPYTTGSAAQVWGKLAGQSILTVTAGSGSRSYNITVVPGDPYRVVLTPTSLSLERGTSATVTAAMYDRGGNRLAPNFDWKVDNPALTISGTATAGTVTVAASGAMPASPNPATLTATRKGYGLPAASILVTITPGECCPPGGATCTCTVAAANQLREREVPGTTQRPVAEIRRATLPSRRVG
jgi:hypothetical protein